MKSDCNSDPAKKELAASFKEGDRVVYVSKHKKELGIVTSTNDQTVFVLFDEDIERRGWEGATAKGCRPEDLQGERLEGVYIFKNGIAACFGKNGQIAEIQGPIEEVRRLIQGYARDYWLDVKVNR